MNNVENTDYGYKAPGKSAFVIVAPHAAGDDLKSGLIAKKLAKELSGFFIVNNKYFKKTNSKAIISPEFAEDFNKLSWSHTKKKYLWKKKKPAMKIFFEDIRAYCRQARNFSTIQKAVVIYVHGMNHESIGIDIGVGLKEHKRKNKYIGSSASYYYGYFCSGVPTIKIKQMKEIRKKLHQRLSLDYNMDVTVGHYPAWSKRIAVQFQKTNGRNDYAIQLEINKCFRVIRKNRQYICELLSEIFKQSFT